MKKQLLFLAGCLLATIMQASAQQLVGTDGYLIDYRPNRPSSSCITQIGPVNNGGYAFLGGNVDSMFLYGLPGLTVIGHYTNQQTPAYVDLVSVRNDVCEVMRAPFADSTDQNVYLDLSDSIAAVTIYARANQRTRVDFSLAYADGMNYPSVSSHADGIHKIFEVDTLLQPYSFSFADWENRSKVNMYGLTVLDSNAFITIERIAFGTLIDTLDWVDTTWVDTNTTVARYRCIQGTVYNDTNSNCSLQSEERGVPYFMVRATSTDNGLHYYGYTDSSGFYSICVPDTGHFVVIPVFANVDQSVFHQSCDSSQVITLTSLDSIYCCVNFGINVRSCALLNVYVSSDRRRRCFTSNTYVSYSNYGGSNAEATTIKVFYPEYVVPLSSTPMWTHKNGDTLIYELPSVAAGTYGFITIVDSAVCGIESIRGLTQCTQATISSVSTCEIINPAWDRSSVAVFGNCLEEEVRFVIYNKGSGNMTLDSPYRLYLNDTLVYESTFRLNAGDSLKVNFPAHGETFRLEADQCIYHPGRSFPSSTVQACNRSDSSFFVTNGGIYYVMDGQDPHYAISCLQITDSYDPNDKQAEPVGFTDDHLIKAAEGIKYTIRFQNTGSDVAFKIKVVDTLDTDLDVATFTEGSASHPYVLDVNTVNGKTILTYTFNNINLKDSTTSEKESHGFLSFFIKTGKHAVDGTEITNKADIFFDFNSAIETNAVRHTIGTFHETDLTKGNNVQVVTGLFDQKENTSNNEATVYPNPATDQVHVALKQGVSGTIEITDLSGQLQFTNELNGAVSSFSVASLKSGMYFYKIHRHGEWISSGKLLIK